MAKLPHIGETEKCMDDSLGPTLFAAQRVAVLPGSVQQRAGGNLRLARVRCGPIALQPAMQC